MCYRLLKQSTDSILSWQREWDVHQSSQRTAAARLTGPLLPGTVSQSDTSQRTTYRANTIANFVSQSDTSQFTTT